MTSWDADLFAMFTALRRTEFYDYENAGSPNTDCAYTGASI